jgi:hypothetical protein
MPHDTRITTNSGVLEVKMRISWSFRWPYQANVMNTLEITNRRTVSQAFIVSKNLAMQSYEKRAELTAVEP